MGNGQRYHDTAGGNDLQLVDTERHNAGLLVIIAEGGHAASSGPPTKSLLRGRSGTQQDSGMSVPDGWARTELECNMEMDRQRHIAHG